MNYEDNATVQRLQPKSNLPKAIIICNDRSEGERMANRLKCFHYAFDVVCNPDEAMSRLEQHEVAEVFVDWWRFDFDGSSYFSRFRSFGANCVDVSRIC